MLVVLAAVVAALAFARLRYSGSAPAMPAASCNADLWKHVYRPERLSVLQACTSVVGRVASVRRAADGDLHIALDPDRKSVLNLVNVMHSHRHLIVEVACQHTPSNGGALTACAGFNPPATLVKVGDRVRVTGAYVTDRDNGWNEIHPVTSIETVGP